MEYSLHNPRQQFWTASERAAMFEESQKSWVVLAECKRLLALINTSHSPHVCKP